MICICGCREIQIEIHREIHIEILYASNILKYEMFYNSSNVYLQKKKVLIDKKKLSLKSHKMPYLQLTGFFTLPGCDPSLERNVFTQNWITFLFTLLLFIFFSKIFLVSENLVLELEKCLASNFQPKKMKKKNNLRIMVTVFINHNSRKVIH